MLTESQPNRMLHIHLAFITSLIEALEENIPKYHQLCCHEAQYTGPVKSICALPHTLMAYIIVDERKFTSCSVDRLCQQATVLSH